MNWNLKKSSNNKIDYIDNESISNFQIKKGVNYLIGNNNSGKTKLLNSIKSKEIEIETGNNKKPNMIYLSSDSRKLEDENIKDKQLMEGSLIDYITKFEEQPEEITNKILDNFEHSKLLKNFLGNKKINSKKIVTTKIETEIDGVNSNDSGGGENRLFYLIYMLSTFKDKLDNLFNEITTNNILIKEIVVSNKDINMPWDDVNELLNKYIALINKEGRNTLKKYFTEDDIKVIQIIVDDITFNGKLVEKFWLFKMLENKIFRDDLGTFEFYINSNGINYKNFSDLVSNWKIREEIVSFGKNNKKEIVDFYIKNSHEEVVVGPSWDFIVMIDEPENYIHSSKYLLVKEILNMILNFGNEYGVDTRILINTHDDRIIKLIPEYIWNTNIAWKEENKIFYKNVFDNSSDEFIRTLQKNVDDYFVNSKFKNLMDSGQEVILKRYKSIDNKFVEWFLCHKENFRIFFNRNIMVTEGYQDKFCLKNIAKEIDIETEVIETDGTREGLLIWSLIIFQNIKLFNKVSFLIDLDLKKTKEKGKYMYLENTYLMRILLFDKFSNFQNVNLYFSKYNDITQWANFIEHKKNFLNKNNEIYSMMNKDESLFEDEYQEDYDQNTLNFIKSYDEFNHSKNKYSSFELQKQIESIVEHNKKYTIDLFNESMIIKDINDFLYVIKKHVLNKNYNIEGNSFEIEDGKFYTVDHYDGKKIEIELSQKFSNSFWKIDRDYNDGYIIDLENKLILYIKSFVYDEIVENDGKNSELIEDVKNFSKKYFNIFQPNLLKFDTDEGSAYLNVEKYSRDSLTFEKDISDWDKKMNKYTSRNLLIEIFGTSIPVYKKYIENPKNLTWFNEVYKDKIFYINIYTDAPYSDAEFKKYNYQIGPLNYEEVKKVYDEILENIWVEF